MFLPISLLPAVSEASIQALCPSLNTPVLNIEQLPVGPARAAILLFGGEYGDVCLVVGLRSLVTSEVVIFNYQGDPGHFGSPGSAIDAALSFSEGMGFLFDDDLIAHGGPGGRKRAAQIWESLARQTEAEIDADADDGSDPGEGAEPAIAGASEGDEELSLVELAPDETGPEDDDEDEELLLEESLSAEEESSEEDSAGDFQSVEDRVVVEEVEVDGDWGRSEADAVEVACDWEGPETDDPLIPLEDLEIEVEVEEFGGPDAASGEVEAPDSPSLERSASQAGILSKFRGSAIGSLPVVCEEALPSLGQVPPASVPDGDAGRKPNLLVRLLGSF